MPDREKVIHGLKQCPKLPFVLCFTECTNYSCPYYDEDGIYKLHEDAIALLEEQENDIHHMGLIIDEYEKELNK
jgi:hypothetical protein